MAQLVTLPGSSHPFAAGLSWRHEDTVPSTKSLRILAAEKGQWGIVRKTSKDTFQVGFCAPILGTSPAGKVKSLAAVIADQKPQPWRGTYQIDTDLFWYIAVRDDQEVIPDGDFIGSREEIEALKDSHLGHGEWSEVDDGTIEDLAEMAMALPRPPSLRDFRARKLSKNEILAGAALAAVTLSAIAWFAYDHHLAAEREAASRRQQALAELAANEKRSEEAKILPWTREPMPSLTFHSCRQAWESQDLAIKGWTLQSWACHVDAQNAAITSSWQRQGGLAADAPGILSVDAEHSINSRVLPVDFTVSSPSASSEEQAKRATWTLAQTFGINPAYNPAPPAPAPLPGSDASKQPIDPWTSAIATFPLDAPPWSWLEQPFDGVAGLRIHDITWNGDTQTWIVSGVVYALRGSNPVLSIGNGSKNTVGTRS